MNVLGARITSTESRAVAGRLWVLSLRTAKLDIAEIEVWQLPTHEFELADSARQLAQDMCAPIRTSRVLPVAGASLPRQPSLHDSSGLPVLANL